MKVLFLDIDGVVNSGDNMYALTALWRIDNNLKSRDDFGHLFDERCIKWLDWIVKKTDCKIIISSTWRKSGLEPILEMWETRKLPGEVIGITPNYASKEIVEKYQSENERADRGYEIQEWLDANPVESYCIVDDDSDMLSHQNFVRTDNRIGLNYETSHSIVAFLNKVY